MDDCTAVLSALVSDRVRYHELVKVTIHTSTRKAYMVIADKGISFVTYNLGGVIKNSKIQYSNVEGVEIDERGRRITVKLRESIIPTTTDADPGVREITLETPDYTLLYERIKIAIDTDFIMNSFQAPESEDSTKIEHTSAIFPFYKYKKVTFGGYYLFIKHSFKETTFNTTYTTRYEDERGITMTLNIKDPVPTHNIENDDVSDLYSYTRRFIQELELVSNQTFNEDPQANANILKETIHVLKDEVFHKKMNLNSDVSKWLCYHILIKTSSKFILYFIMRRMYIPPMLDVCQDILIRFDLVLTENSVRNITSYWNEFCTTINSITSNTNQFTWNKELIELRINNLRYKNEIYKHLKMDFNIVPSYFNLVKSFIVSILKLLPTHSIDQYIIYKLSDENNVELYTDEPLEYVYKITSSLFGDVTANNSALVNKFTMRLANYITYAMDELLIGNELLLSLIVKNLETLDPNSRKRLDNVLKFLMHFRPINFNEKYSVNTFNNMLDHYTKSQNSKHKGDLDWTNTVFNYYAVSRFLEEGYVKLLFTRNTGTDFEPSETPVQTSKNTQAEHGYILMICTLIEKFNDYSLHKRIIRNLLDIPLPIPDCYLTIIPSIVHLLAKTSNETLMELLLSLLVNFSYHNDNSKELMINSNIALTLNGYVYIQNVAILLPCLKLILNLTKTKQHQLVFIKSGLLYHLINILHKYFNNNDNIEIISHISAIIGQLYNVKIELQLNKLEYILDIMIYVYVNFKGTIPQFNNILFCVKKILNNRQLSLRVGKQLIPMLMANMNCVNDNDYLINIFELLLKLADHVPNCIIMKENNVSALLEGLSVNVDIIIQFSVRLSTKIKKKTIHCEI